MLMFKNDVYIYDIYFTDVKGNWEIILFKATDAELVQNWMDSCLAQAFNYFQDIRPCEQTDQAEMTSTEELMNSVVWWFADERLHSTAEGAATQ